VTGGQLIQPGQVGITPGNAAIAFSVEIADGTKFNQCSVLVGESAVSASWFGWDVASSPTSMITLEVTAGMYGFHRFGCDYHGLFVRTNTPGPELNLAAGEVRYLGRLIVSDTEFGTAPGYSKMASSVRLQFEDRSDEDMVALRAKSPLFVNEAVEVNVPASLGGKERHALRPDNRGVKVVVSPVMWSEND
jgi:hypothetical protein